MFPGARRPGGALTQRLLQFLERRARHHHAPRIDDVTGTDAVARQQPHAFDVAHRQRQLVFGLYVHEKRLAVDAELAQHLRRRFRLDLAQHQRIHHDHRAILQLLRDGGAQRPLLHLARQVKVVAARLRAEYGAALAPQRIANLAHPRPAGALLPPRLLAGAAHQRPILRRVRAATVGRIGVHHRLVNQIGLDAAAEHFVTEIDRTDLLVLLIDDVYGHGYFLPFFFTGSTWATLSFLAATALRITTTLFGPPGTDPSTRSRLFSASTRNTLRLRTVTRSVPM